MKKLKARDIMTTQVLTVRDDMSLSELASTLSHHMITGAPVVDSSGELVGVVSVTDIARSQATRSVAVRPDRGPDFYMYGFDDQLSDEDLKSFHIEGENDQLVREIMTPMIFSISPDAGLAEMADTMIGGRVHRLVVTEGKTVAGIVTTLDLLKAVRDQTR